MNPFTIAKLVGGVALAAAVITFGLHYRHVAGEAAHYAQCKAAVAGKSTAMLLDDACAPDIAQAVLEARQARACAKGLAPAKDGRWAAPEACGRAIETLAAEHNARAWEVGRRDTEITRLMAERGKDVARAEARGLANGRRETRDANTLASAPRGPDGRVTCDTECLRALTGDP